MRHEEQQEISVPTPAVIGVLGDTHMLRGDPHTRLAPVLDLFQRATVDLILHAGDTGALALLRTLEEIAPVVAVRGNADPVETLDALPEKRQLRRRAGRPVMRLTSWSLAIRISRSSSARGKRSCSILARRRSAAGILTSA